MKPDNSVRAMVSEATGELLGQRMWELLRDPSMRQGIAETNRGLALVRYDVRAVCNQMGEIYRRVADLA